MKMSYIGAHINKESGSITKTMDVIKKNHGNALQLFVSNPRSASLPNMEVYKNISKEIGGGQSATNQDLDGRGRTSLRREYQNLYHYVQGGNGGLSTIRREMMFINLLQGLHPKEAEVLIFTKDKKLSDKYKITLENVKEAYPDIRWGGRS